jgi:protein-tyrosine phosphatase
MKPDIYWIPGPWTGRLAILGRPRRDDWLRDEIEGWRDAGVQVIVSLLSEAETLELGLSDEAPLVRGCGLTFINFPIDDYSVPSSEEALQRLVNELESLLNEGQTVGIHCRAGVGRSSLVAACLLVNSGEDAELSFQRISNSRGVRVPDTTEQRRWVGNFARLSLTSSINH